jgi:hypothetical protein
MNKKKKNHFLFQFLKVLYWMQDGPDAKARAKKI